METSLFKSPTFLCFWAGQIASSLAFQMLVVGIGWQMYALTNSALNLGLVGLAQFLPQLALTLFAGHAVDQYNRRRIILFARLVMAATVLVLAVGCFTQTINATMIYACSAILGATRAFEMPATQALLPNLIEPGLLSRALALGASDMISVVIRSTLVQLETPDEMRGRVSAANSIFIGTSNQLGEFESGVTAAWLGVVPAIVLGGIGTLLVVTLWMKGFPVLTQRQTLE
ncbi:MFS transporter [Brenneria uluponensis]|uniref:MFS transporter n=1 Tax=Brenneria uluponensis TaxID=3057057 RepID=UPI0028E69A98|nr:MFS transporter [Brenneria ulupoensis]